MEIRNRIRELSGTRVVPLIQLGVGVAYLGEAAIEFSAYQITKDHAMFDMAFNNVFGGVWNMFATFGSYKAARDYGRSLSDPMVNRNGIIFNVGELTINGTFAIANPALRPSLLSYAIMSIANLVEAKIRKPPVIATPMKYTGTVDEVLTKIERDKKSLYFDENWATKSVCFAARSAFIEKTGNDVDDRAKEFIHEDAELAVHDVLNSDLSEAGETLHLKRLKGLEEGKEMYSIKL